MINWTATYRRDSDIVAPYERWVYYNPKWKQRATPEKNYAANKTKTVAWFVSNCAARNNRLQYANELKKYIPVDIYGACGSKKCPRFPVDSKEMCFHMLDKDYKFYLAFENSNCRDYITEKLFVNGLGWVSSAFLSNKKFLFPIRLSPVSLPDETSFRSLWALIPKTTPKVRRSTRTFTWTISLLRKNSPLTFTSSTGTTNFTIRISGGKEPANSSTLISCVGCAPCFTTSIQPKATETLTSGGEVRASALNIRGANPRKDTDKFFFSFILEKVKVGCSQWFAIERLWNCLLVRESSSIRFLVPSSMPITGKIFFFLFKFSFKHCNFYFLFFNAKSSRLFRKKL